MKPNLNKFQTLFNQHAIYMQYKEVIKDFKCYLVTETINNINEVEKLQNKSKIIIIDKNCESDDQYFFICLDNAIIIVSRTKIELMSHFFENERQSYIYAVSDYIKEEEFFTQIQLKFCNDIRDYEIENYKCTIDHFKSSFSINFRRNNESVSKIWPLILPCLSTFFINKSYKNLAKSKNNDKTIKITEMKDDEFICLQNLGLSTTSHIQLIYHIKLEQLFVLKHYLLSAESDKLFEREFGNYQKTRNLSIPRFYGKIKADGKQYLIIEYIRGLSLSNIGQISFQKEEKFNLIFEIMAMIECFQRYELIYRDFKPDNLFIDENKRIVLIDLDRMIDKEEQKNIKVATKDFNNLYQAPEVFNGTIEEYTYEEDVYSLGLLIYFILNEKDPQKINENYSFDNFPTEYFELKKICEDCIQNDPKKRPKITNVIDSFINNFLPNIVTKKIDLVNGFINKQFFPYWILINEYDNNEYKEQLDVFYQQETINNNIKHYIKQYSLELNINHLISQFIIREKYYPEKYFKDNIDKIIHYFTLAADKNDVIAQKYLGLIYFEGKYISRDINKAIHYYTLAANQNNAAAQNNLGYIYRYVSPNLKKAFYYFKLSADQNFVDAQNNLALMYHEGKFVSKNIDKAIYYYTLAAKQNSAKAQNNLGTFYLEGKFVSQDINKAINYFKLAADQNNAIAQKNLGSIYLEGKFVSRDIKKAINYFTLAANQNNVSSQSTLGLIYYEGKYISRDINKAIHYFTFAADKKDLIAQKKLGFIYSDGKFISKDFNKAFYYFLLAANQNDSISQSIIGIMYHQGQCVSQDISKAIYYYTLAANQNNSIALLQLGIIYSEGKYVPRDINRAIYYYTQAANQNNSTAQNNLGIIYYEGKYVSKDINKAILYFTLAANQNNAVAQSNLGLIYYEGKYVPQDINKAIYYYTLAANQKDSTAQLNLGIIYYKNMPVQQFVNKGVYYLTEASCNRCKSAHFYVGFLYHEGKYVDQDINKAIHYYKDGSSFNDQYCKNNLAILYKNGYNDKIESNINLSIEYFQEAIRQKNDALSMYNLSNIYIYDNRIKQNLDKSIELLIISINLGFYPSYFLIGIALVLKAGFDIKNIEYEMDMHKDITKSLKEEVIETIKYNNLCTKSFFDRFHKNIKNICFLYDFNKDFIFSDEIINQKEFLLKSKPLPSITKEFYEGFAIDI